MRILAQLVAQFAQEVIVLKRTTQYFLPVISKDLGRQSKESGSLLLP
jgi:hypothetical protein